MDLSSSRRLQWALAASLAAHAVILASLPGARMAVLNAAGVKPMRVVRVHEAGIIPARLVSAAIAAPLRAAKPQPQPRRLVAAAAPAPRRQAPAAPRPGPETSLAPGPAAPLRSGPPEASAALPAPVAPSPAGEFVLPQPASGGSSAGPGSGGANAASGGARSASGGQAHDMVAASGLGKATGSPAPPSGTAPAAAAPEPTVPPFALSLPKPPYPDECRRRSQEGTVRLRVLVLRDGSVGRAELARPSGVTAFDRAALEGARGWRFSPARRGASAVEAWVALSVVFRLEDMRR